MRFRFEILLAVVMGFAIVDCDLSFDGVCSDGRSVGFKSTFENYSAEFIVPTKTSCFLICCNHYPCDSFSFDHKRNICGIFINAKLYSHSISRIKRQTDMEGVTNRSCFYGLSECREKEYCLVSPERNHSRRGYCRCVNHYKLNKDGYCIKEQSATNGPKVQINGPSIVESPLDFVVLTANISDGFPKHNESSPVFHWNVSRVVSHDNKKRILISNNSTEEILNLTSLRIGRYFVDLFVDLNYNESLVSTVHSNFTFVVLSPKLKKTGAIYTVKAVIIPEHVETEENKKIILDGSASKASSSNVKIVDWKWTVVSGPDSSSTLNIPSTATAVFEHLPPGNYTFRLTVKDDRGNEDNTTADVIVHKEIDYPPKAEAGLCEGERAGDVSVRLPVAQVLLCGNMSTDDKGIVTWKWTRKNSDSLTADLEGSTSPVLKISNLQAGDYQFALEVKDEKNQISSTEVHIVVLPAENKPPVAKAGADKTIFYPDNSVILDGSQSSDDGRIVSYQWSQISGPTDSKMINSDKPTMTALDLIKGVYNFQVNVTDDQGLWSSDNVTIFVEESHNLPPVARFSDSLVILPQEVAYLDGSASSDDAGIVSWLWTLMDESPGGLAIFDEDRKKPILPVANLIEGFYKFNLTVCDKQKMCNFKIANLNISRGPKESESVEIVLKTNFRNFIVKKQAKFVTQMETFLASNSNWDEVKVHITSLKQNFHGSSILINFYCELIKATAMEQKSAQLLTARSIVEYMDEKLNDFQLLCDYKILDFNTKYCKNACSGRGYCDKATKMCHCNSFWMPNFIKARNPRRTNCDWSILYFLVVVVMFSFVLLAVLTYFIYSMRKQGSTLYNSWSKNRRYKTLNGVFPAAKTKSKRKSSKNGYNNVVNSDSESLLSSEEEVIYDKCQTKNKKLVIPSNDIPLNSLPTLNVMT